MKEIDQRSVYLADVAVAQVKLNREKAGRDNLDEAVKLARSIKIEKPGSMREFRKAHVLVDLAEKHLDAGFRSGAKMLLDEADDIARDKPSQFKAIMALIEKVKERMG